VLRVQGGSSKFSCSGIVLWQCLLTSKFLVCRPEKRGSLLSEMKMTKFGMKYSPSLSQHIAHILSVIGHPYVLVRQKYFAQQSTQAVLKYAKAKKMES
jgi:hypothetical protein